jgi:hypothetical protein
MAQILQAVSGSGVLSGAQSEFTPNVEIRDDSMYLVDFSKLTSVQDLITVFASMGVSFHKSHPHWKNIERFLDLNQPIPLNRPQVSEEKELKLPKIKKV